MTQLPKVLLVGNGPTSLSAFESLAERFTLVGIFRELAEDAKDKDDLVRLAQAHGVPVYFETTPLIIDAVVRKLQPDCVVVSSYNRILGRDLLGNCRFINVHYAPLPRYRGRACVNWAIINGEATTAITIHELAADLDAGNILFQQFIPIGESDTVTDIYRTLNEVQRHHLAATVKRYLDGDVGTVQIETEATYGCTRLPEDGEIDWTATTRATFAMIRALTDPFPGAYTHLNGRRMVVWRAEPIARPRRYSGRIPGRVTLVSRDTGNIDVLTGDGVLRISEVQLEGDTKRPAAEVVKSVRTTLGVRSGDLLERISHLEREIRKLMPTDVSVSET